MPKADKGLIAKMLKPLVAGAESSNSIVRGLSRGAIDKGIDLSAIIAPNFMKGLAKDAMSLSKGNASYDINSYLDQLTSKDLDDLSKLRAYQGIAHDEIEHLTKEGELDRNLLDLYLGDDSKFKEARWLSELESEGINSMKSYTDRHGPLKSYELFSHIPNKQPLSALDLFSKMLIANPDKSGPRSWGETYDDFVGWRDGISERTKKNPEYPDEVIDAYNHIFDEWGDDVIPFEINPKVGYYPDFNLWRNPVSPIDDVAGHMAFLKRTSPENFDFTTRDVWGFHPKNYSNKWLSDQNVVDSQGYIKDYGSADNYFRNLAPKLLDKFGKPFILTQTNPLHFDFVGGEMPFRPRPLGSYTGKENFAKPPKLKSLGGELPRGDKGLITKLGQWVTGAKNVFGTAKNTIKGATGFTNHIPSLSKASLSKASDLSKSSLLKNVDSETMQLVSHLKDANLISPTLNESLLSTYPNLLNLATKKGIQDALTFTRSTTPSTVEGISSSGTRTPISNIDLNAFKKFGLLEDEPGMAMYTASHVPGMRYGRRDGLSGLPYKSQFVGGAEQGTPTSLDALYTFPNNSGVPEGVQKGMFGDTYGNYATILRYPFDYSGSALDMFNRYKTFENAVFDKAKILKKYRGSKGAFSGDIGALNFKDEPTLNNAFYQSMWNTESEVPFVGHPGQKVLEPVATYTKPIVTELKTERDNINKLYQEGKYEEVIEALNKKVKSGDFGSIDSNIKSYKISSKFPKFDVSKYNLRDKYDYTDGAPFTLGIFDPKTGLIPTDPSSSYVKNHEYFQGDLRKIANYANSAYHQFIEKGPLMDAFRDPSNVVKYPYSPLKYKFKKGGQLPKADKGLITKIPELLNFKKSANILDDLLVRTNNLWQTPQGISRLNEMIVNTPSLNSLNLTPEAMLTDLSNITNLNHISDDAVKQKKIFLENQKKLQEKLRNANNANATRGEKNLISAEQGRNRKKLFEIQKKIDNLKEYYPGPGSYAEPKYSWEGPKKNPFGHSISLAPNTMTAADAPMIGMHEIFHFPGMFYGKLSPNSTTYHTYLDDMLSGLELKSDSELIKQTVDYGTPLKYNMGNLTTGEFRNELKDKFGNVVPGEFEHPLLSAKNYYKKYLQEMSPFFAEVREKMLQDGFIKHPYETMTPTKLKAYYNNYNNITDNKYPLRYFEIMKPTKNNFKLSSDVFNKMLIGLPAVGAAALGSDLDEKAVGGPALGDEVDEVTMERLKEQGYTFEKI